jgi:hypothetical protein
VTAATGSIANNTSVAATATCPVGYLAVGGGGAPSALAAKTAITESFPASATSWTTAIGTTNGSTITGTVYVVCAK